MLVLLVGHDRAEMLKINPHIVETLQLLAPGVSLKDETTLNGFVHSGKDFSNSQNQNVHQFGSE